MPEKRKDNKGRVLREGEVQRSDGKYMYRYTDSGGVRRAIYSWKLVESDKAPEAGHENPDDEAAGHAQEGRQGGSRSRRSEEGGGHRLLQGRDRAAVR